MNFSIFYLLKWPQYDLEMTFWYFSGDKSYIDVSTLDQIKDWLGPKFCLKLFNVNIYNKIYGSHDSKTSQLSITYTQYFIIKINK